METLPSSSYYATLLIVLSHQALRVSWNLQRGIPGPNAYNLQSSLLPKHTFLRGSTGNFRLPIAVRTDSVSKRTPAPNHYNVGALSDMPNAKALKFKTRIFFFFFADGPHEIVDNTVTNIDNL